MIVLILGILHYILRGYRSRFPTANEIMMRAVGISESGRSQGKPATAGNKISTAPKDGCLVSAKLDESVEVAHKISQQQRSRYPRSYSADPCLRAVGTSESGRSQGRPATVGNKASTAPKDGSLPWVSAKLDESVEVAQRIFEQQTSGYPRSYSADPCVKSNSRLKSASKMCQKQTVASENGSIRKLTAALSRTVNATEKLLDNRLRKTVASAGMKHPEMNVAVVALRQMYCQALREKLPKAKALINGMREQEKSLQKNHESGGHPGHLQPKASERLDHLLQDPLQQKSDQKNYLQQDSQWQDPLSEEAKLKDSLRQEDVQQENFWPKFLFEESTEVQPIKLQPSLKEPRQQDPDQWDYPKREILQRDSSYHEPLQWDIELEEECRKKQQNVVEESAQLKCTLQGRLIDSLQQDSLWQEDVLQEDLCEESFEVQLLKLLPSLKEPRQQDPDQWNFPKQEILQQDSSCHEPLQWDVELEKEFPKQQQNVVEESAQLMCTPRGLVPLDGEKESICSDTQEQIPLATESKWPRSVEKVPIAQSKSSVKPVFCGYQLIGDSLLLRFSEQVLGEKCIYDGGLRYLGFCVSGQTSAHLLKRVRRHFATFADKVILLIGTNDMLQGIPMQVIKHQVYQLVQLLLGKCCVHHLVLLTLPPIPRKETVKGFWFRLTELNDFLHNLPQLVAASKSRFTVIDITQYFLSRSFSSNLDLFERWYDESHLRPDLIHLNRKGLMVLRKCLEDSGELGKENQ